MELVRRKATFKTKDSNPSPKLLTPVSNDTGVFIFLLIKHQL